MQQATCNRPITTAIEVARKWAARRRVSTDLNIAIFRSVHVPCLPGRVALSQQVGSDWYHPLDGLHWLHGCKLQVPAYAHISNSNNANESNEGCKTCASLAGLLASSIAVVTVIAFSCKLQLLQVVTFNCDRSCDMVFSHCAVNVYNVGCRVPWGFWSIRQERRRHNQLDWARYDNEIIGSEPDREWTAGYD